MDEGLRQLVWSRAEGICEYCRMPQPYDRLPFQIDHIIARQHGGDDAAENLALSCLACNTHKGPNIAGVDPATGEIVRLFNPRRDKWREHFRWAGPELAGQTQEGRATVVVLAINLPHRAVLRESLMAEGVYPSR